MQNYIMGFQGTNFDWIIYFSLNILILLIFYCYLFSLGSFFFYILWKVVLFMAILFGEGEVDHLHSTGMYLLRITNGGECSTLLMSRMPYCITGFPIRCTLSIFCQYFPGKVVLFDIQTISFSIINSTHFFFPFFKTLFFLSYSKYLFICFPKVS